MKPLSPEPLASTGTARTESSTPPRFNAARLLLEGRAFFALIAIVIVFSFLSPNYFTLGNFLTMATHVAIFGILAVGMLLVILNGGIDLSVGSTLGLSGVVAGYRFQKQCSATSFVALECQKSFPGERD